MSALRECFHVTVEPWRFTFKENCNYSHRGKRCQKRAKWFIRWKCEFTRFGGAGTVFTRGQHAGRCDLHL